MTCGNYQQKSKGSPPENGGEPFCACEQKKSRPKAAGTKSEKTLEHLVRERSGGCRSGPVCEKRERGIEKGVYMFCLLHLPDEYRIPDSRGKCLRN